MKTRQDTQVDGAVVKMEEPQRSPQERGNRSDFYTFVCIVILFSACILVFHTPGSLSQDSMFVLNEAITVQPGQFNEWYSPSYTLLWKGMISGAAKVAVSPFFQVSTMCVLQTVLIVGALVWLLRAQPRMTWRKTAIASAIVIASPAIFVYFGEIWRDVLMAALLLVAVCLLDSFSRTESWATLATAIGVLFLAALIRQNAFIAELPLFFWAGFLWHRRAKQRYGYAAIWTIILLLSFAAGWSRVNRLLASSNLGRGASSIMYYDLMGISIRTGELLLPRNLTVPGYSLEDVRARYQDEYNDLTGVVLPTDAVQMQTVFAAWREAVLKHPEAYLEHRSLVMLRYLGISKLEHLPYFYGIPESIYPSYIKDRSYYLRFPSTRVRKWEGEWLHVTEYWLFRPWVYGTLTMAILLFTWRNRGTSFWLCASGGVYWLSNFFSIPSTDFRYGWWDVLAVSTALALIIVQWFARLQQREAEYMARFHGGSRRLVIAEEAARK